MKRILVTLGLIAAAAASAVTVAGAADSRTYQAELFNAFGLVKGSELRVAGAKAGTITDLEVTPQKTALVSFEVDPEFPEFKADASCSSEPQSLIAEYFLDCQPGISPDPLEGPIPAAQNKTTVQPDLAQNTLREPFKDRLQLLINEFGTALDANAENLNAAIRSGAPALRELKQVLNILGRQNTTIAQLNADSDAIFAQLADRREDVVNFIDNAGRTAAISAERSEDLSRNFDLLDDFLAELQPTMVELEKLARFQTPLLTDLRAAAPGLNKLATNLPPFNRGTRDSLLSLGRAAAVGKVALDKSKEEIAALNQTSTKAYPAADEVAKFLESIDDPSNATEEDCDARRDLRDQPGEADRRVALLEQKLGTNLTGDQSLPDCDAGTGSGNPGYTGMEGLLNYAYTQTLSLNLFDQLGHGLGRPQVFAPGGGLRLPGRAGGAREGLQHEPRDDHRPDQLRRVRRDPRRPPAQHQLRGQSLRPVRQPRPLPPERLSGREYPSLNLRSECGRRRRHDRASGRPPQSAAAGPAGAAAGADREDPRREARQEADRGGAEEARGDPQAAAGAAAPQPARAEPSEPSEPRGVGLIWVGLVRDRKHPRLPPGLMTAALSPYTGVTR
jgi:ABC-type transporter Mla subunit MlaD